MEDPKRSSGSSLDSIDVAKFAMSIVIVAIHSGLGGDWHDSLIYPLARIAVPVFFVISGYLFFRKYNVCNEQQKKSRLKKFVVRNMQLYAFWFIVLLVPTIVLRKYFADGVLFGLLKIVRGFLFGSTFVASWYITATVIAVCAIVFLAKKIGNIPLFLGSALCYVFACLSSNYANLFSGNEAITHIAESLFPVLGVPYNNFVVAFLWIMIGKMFAEKESELRKRYSEARFSTAVWVALVVSCGFLCAEQFVIRLYDLAFTNDCYLLLPVPVILLFAIILNTDMQSRHAKEFRAASTITYCFHGTFLSALRFVLGRYDFFDYGCLEFALGLAASWVVTYAILKLEDKQVGKLLRYSH